MKFIALICLLFTSLFSNAHNNHFYLGDAYFSGYWELNLPEKPVESLVWHYEPLTHRKMDCGNGGVSSILIKNFTEDYLKSLKKADEIIIENIKNSSKPYYQKRVLIYNKDYDFEKWGVAYRYNEDWAKQQVETYKVGHAKYDRLGGQARVIQDWRDASKVKGLRCKVIDKEIQDNGDPFGNDEEMNEDNPFGDNENEEDERKYRIEKTRLMNQSLEGNVEDFAFVVILSNTADRMMENTSAELNIEFYEDDAKTRLEKEKKLKAIKEKPVDLFKFMVITEKIRIFEELKDEKWKITEVKLSE